jgi:CHAT domain-containing protein
VSFGAPAKLARGLQRIELDDRDRGPGAERGDLVAQARVIRAEAELLDLPALGGIAALREGELLLAQGDARGAAGAFEASARAFEQADATDQLAIALARSSEALVAAGDMRAALDVCARGIELVERDRGKTSGAYMQAAYLRRTVSLHANGVLAAHARGDSRALEWAELAKGRVPAAASAPPAGLRNELRELGERIDGCRDADAARALRQRRRVLYDRLLAAVRPGPRERFDAAAAQAALAPGQRAVSCFWVDRSRLLIAVLARDEVATVLRSVTAEQRAAVDRLAAHVLGSGAEVEYHVRDTLVARALRELSPLLLPDGGLDGAERLLFSPHRALHAVPPAALRLGGEPLVRRMAVAVIPNLTCLQSPTPAPPAGRVVVAGADAYDGARRLDGAEDAAAEIAELYEQRGFAAERLLGEEASGVALRAALAGAPPACLHLMLHGASVVADTPLESFLLLARSRLDGLDLAEWRLAGATVVLAACSSGQRAIAGRGMEELPGDDVLGLQAAFFAAGARQLLGALWPVDLDVTRGIVRRFHAELLVGRAGDVALRAALLGHLGEDDPRTGGVRCWAPFTLTAAGQPLAIGRDG